MSVSRNRPGVRRRALRRWLVGALASPILFFVVACDGDQRCSTNAECETGQVCSNEKDLLAVGVCISPCTRHINAPACIDASVAVDASQALDAGVDAAIDGANP